MAEIIEFPIQQVRRGPIYCAPLGIYFPALVRQIITITNDHLSEFELRPEDGIEPSTWTVYGLDRHPPIIGESNCEEVTHINREDQSESIVIRHHRTRAEAHGYLDACLDHHLAKFDEEGDSDESSLFQSDQGIFTMATIPSGRTWPGPLVFYLAKVPGDNGNREQYWAHIVGPSGVMIPPAAYGF